jgi:hypothetical protein
VNVLVGDARAGAAHCENTCAQCHSAAGDLQGIATRIPDARTLQNTWVAGRGRLIFGGDTAGNLIAHDAESGAPLWHSRIGQVTNAPITYKLGDRQYLLVASDNRLYAFTLY